MIVAGLAYPAHPQDSHKGVPLRVHGDRRGKIPRATHHSLRCGIIA